MDPRTDPASIDDIERLASCLGLLVAEGGEAENAARAARTIARRLGLSGGQLKQMFIAGTAAVTGTRADVSDDQDVASLHRQLSAAEIARVASRREVEFLDRQNATLRQALGDSGASARRWRIASFVAVALFAALFVATALRTRSAVPVPAAERPGLEGTPFGRAAVVRSGGTTLFVAPDSSSAINSPLPAGTHLIVRRLLWKMLQQWAEVEIAGGSRTGYVVTTGINMS